MATVNERRFTTWACAHGEHDACDRDPRTMPSAVLTAVCQCECHDAPAAQDEPRQPGIPCAHCQTPMDFGPCGDCEGSGNYGWEQDERGRWYRRACATCYGTGDTWHCPNLLHCPGKVWYPADARCAGMVRAAKGGA